MAWFAFLSKKYWFTGHNFKRKWSYDPGQNIRKIVRKSIKYGRDQKNLIFDFG